MQNPYPTPPSPSEAENALDDVLVSRTEHRRVMDHIFFQASQQVSHETSQAIARIAIVGLVTLLVLFNAILNQFAFNTILNLAIGFGYLAYGLVHFWWTRRYRQRFAWRRYIAIFGDLSCTSYVTYSFGLAGLGFYPLFLWIIIGNGLRFGPRYLRIATSVGVGGFLAANLLNGALLEQPGVVAGLIIGLLLMPKFFLVMIRRLADANQVLHEQKEEAEYLARHDRLTGLPNRVLLEDRLTHALGNAARNGSRPAIIFLDLDGFKSINDNFGHDYGDILLKEIASCLRATVRRSDTVARLGGDEFIILIEAANGPAEVAAVVDQIFTCAGRYYQMGEYRAYVTWSCGVAIYPNDGRDSQTLIKNADIAMYRAKAAGSNQFRLYDPAMSEEVANQLKLRDQLRHALETRQFKVLYQPIGRYPEARIDGFEVRIYWHRNHSGWTPLLEFSDLLEQSGLNAAVGNLALDKCIADAAQWQRAGLTEVKLQIEITAQQLASGDFHAHLQKLLNLHGLPHQSLCIEFNENLLINESDFLVAQIDALRSMGVRIALNHFGAGYAALGLLKRHAIDRIVIAPSLVAELPGDAASSTLVEALLAIAERTAIEVVADGIESETQLSWFLDRRCQRLQGNYISPPLSATEVENLLGKGTSKPLTLAAGH